MSPNAIFDAVVGFLRSINAVLSIVPALVWALLLVAAAGYGSLMHHERDTAVRARDVVQASYEALTAKVIHQKNEATNLYRRLLAERDALQAHINEAHRAQEIKDANDRKIIADQAARLAALTAAAPGGQLRDPNGAGCGRGGEGTEGHAAADERGSEEHPAAAGGLVSAPLSRLLVEHTADADKWARLYGLARADAMMCWNAMRAAP